MFPIYTPKTVTLQLIVATVNSKKQFEDHLKKYICLLSLLLFGFKMYFKNG